MCEYRTTYDFCRLLGTYCESVPIKVCLKAQPTEEKAK